MPYLSKNLDRDGLDIFIDAMRDAILNGSEVSLTAALGSPRLWLPTETYVLKGIPRQRQINIPQAASRLALSEFNTWYVRGLAHRLLDEGIENCQVYRAAVPKWEPADCSTHEGLICSVLEVYNGHRARYWPKPGSASILSVPFNPNCHHTIRRIA